MKPFECVLCAHYDQERAENYESPVICRTCESGNLKLNFKPKRVTEISREYDAEEGPYKDFAGIKTPFVSLRQTVKDECNKAEIENKPSFDKWQKEVGFDKVTPSKHQTKSEIKPAQAPKDTLLENKPQPSVLPMDLLIEYLEPAYREGILKYYRESWREGFHTTIMFDALQRHLTKFFYEGEEFDQESFERFGIKKTHLGASLFCILAILNTLKTKPELDDRFIKKEEL